MLALIGEQNLLRRSFAHVNVPFLTEPDIDIIILLHITPEGVPYKSFMRNEALCGPHVALSVMFARELQYCHLITQTRPCNIKQYFTAVKM